LHGQCNGMCIKLGKSRSSIKLSEHVQGLLNEFLYQNLILQQQLY